MLLPIITLLNAFSGIFTCLSSVLAFSGKNLETGYSSSSIHFLCLKNTLFLVAINVSINGSGRTTGNSSTYSTVPPLPEAFSKTKIVFVECCAKSPDFVPITICRYNFFIFNIHYIWLNYSNLGHQQWECLLFLFLINLNQRHNYWHLNKYSVMLFRQYQHEQG